MKKNIKFIFLLNLLFSFSIKSKGLEQIENNSNSLQTNNFIKGCRNAYKCEFCAESKDEYQEVEKHLLNIHLKISASIKPGDTNVLQELILYNCPCGIKFFFNTEYLGQDDESVAYQTYFFNKVKEHILQHSYKYKK